MNKFIIIMGWLGLFWALVECVSEYRAKKRNPEKYTKEEEPRVKSFFDVI